MNIWSRIRRLSIPQLFKLSLLLLRHPLLILPTLKATRATLKVSDSLYGKAHHKNGKANAFRHALWNMMICYKTLNSTKDINKSVGWAEKITDLHEKLSPNKPLEATMDLHNNAFGRKHFSLDLYKTMEEMVIFLTKELQNAQKVTKMEEIKEVKMLVYIE